MSAGKACWSLKSDPVDVALRHALSRALRSLRKQHNQERAGSQEGLALEAGLSRGYVSELERGEHDPGLWTLWRVKTAFNIPFARLAKEIEQHYRAPANSNRK
jgi:transcriptional regulator with XRE-family HTH domain